MKKQVILDVICPVCHKSLMDNEIEIKGLPSVCLNIRTEDLRQGTVHLCGAYECFEHLKDIPVKEGEIAGFYCPHCHSELLTGEICQVCGAPLVEMKLASGGIIKICSRFGCFNHFLSLADLEAERHRLEV